MTKPDLREQRDRSQIEDPFDSRTNDRKEGVPARDELLRAIEMAERAGDRALVERLRGDLARLEGSEG